MPAPPPPIPETVMTEEVITAMCGHISGGMSVSKACQQPGMPSTTTWWRWLADDANESLRVKFTRSRELGTHALADQCIEIIDDDSGDTRIIKVRGEDEEVQNSEFISRSRARVETRLRLIGMWNKRYYGDKKVVEHTGPNGGPIKTINGEMTPQEAAEAYADTLREPETES